MGNKREKQIHFEIYQFEHVIVCFHLVLRPTLLKKMYIDRDSIETKVHLRFFVKMDTFFIDLILLRS